MSRRKRIDGNQAAIVEGLRKLGVFVEPRLARIGEGVPDLLVCHRGVWRVAEIKMAKEELSDAEYQWWERVPSDAPFALWRSLDDARKTLGL